MRWRKWWRDLSGPRRHALIRGARAAIVIPLTFGLAHLALGNPRASVFAAFGGFALLVLIDWAGWRRYRLFAYLAMAGLGAVLITVGTLASRNSVLALFVTLVIVFVALFAGVLNGYVQAASTGAVLLFVLPISIPGDLDAVPPRLIGWGLACVVAIPTALFLWPDRPRYELWNAAANACDAIAEVMEKTVRGQPGEAARVAHVTVAEMRELYVTTPYRPSRTPGGDRALVCVGNELDWLFSLTVRVVADAGGSPATTLTPREDAEVAHQCVAVLRACADRLRGGSAEPDLLALDTARIRLASAVVGRVREIDDDAFLARAISPPLRIRALSYATYAVATTTLRATGGTARVEEAASTVRERSVAEPLGRYARTPPPRRPGNGRWARAVSHLTPHSVWFRNSVRGAVGVALAVYIAQILGVSNAFWVVLATLSVLRSTATGTGVTVLRALVGTVIGVVVGAGIVILVGSHLVLLWVLLPFVVFLASFVPGLSFTGGQVSFSLMVLILFNIVRPTGWQVGLIRLEDIGIGCAISLLVGVMLWPRGADAVLWRQVAASYRSGIDYITAAVRDLAASRDRAAVRAPDSRTEFESASRTAGSDNVRLDDAFGQYLARQTVQPERVSAAAALVAGANRLLLAGHALAALAHVSEARARAEGIDDREPPGSADDPDPLGRQSESLRGWYYDLAASVADPAMPVPAAQPRNPADHAFIVRCLRRVGAAERDAQISHTLHELWATQQLAYIWDLEPRLVGAAGRLSGRVDAQEPPVEPVSRGPEDPGGR
ncbi:FUSC family protein [Actinopolymorpha pittospori]